MSNFPKAHITGERTIRFSFGNHIGEETFHHVQRFCELIEKESKLTIEEFVPSYHTVTVYVKNEFIQKDQLIHSLLTKWEQDCGDKTIRKNRTLRIPVCYSEEFALDMERVMNYTSLSEREIVSLHSNTLYTVYMIGFLPGFPYLGGLNEKLSTPRLNTPRLKVPQSTVGIGGSQTGIYPLECPGGWNIIGKTPLHIYRPKEAEPFFIKAGDFIEFYSISNSDFYNMKKNLEKYPESVKEFILEE